MTSSRRYGRLLQAASLGLIGMLTVVGCGGSDTPRKDAGPDGGDAAPAAKAQLSADKVSVSVGSVDVGKTSTPVVVKITNTGTAQATLTVVQNDFTATGCPTTLAINASCNLSITATPMVAGAISGNVSVAATGSNVVTIAVTGVATLPGNFSFSPSSVEIGNVAVGSATPAVITVTANATLTGITAGVSSAGANLKIDSTTCSTTAPMLAGSTCTINVTFSAAAAGRVTTDAVTITQGGVTKSVPVNANVLMLAKLISTPQSASLTAAPGATSAPIAINIGNIGGMQTGQVTVQLTGDKAADFRIVDDKCSITQILPTAFCTVTVVYAPAATVVAEETAILTVADKGAGLSTVNVSLTGIPNLPASLAITGGPALGSVARGSSGAEVVFTVTNGSPTPSGALTVSVTDANIAISSNTCATVATLNKGETCTVGLKLAPPATATPASIAALLRVTSASGTANASVTGTILGGPALSANPTSITFGSVFITQSSDDKSITVTNTGATATGALSVTLTGAGAAQVAIVGNTCDAAALAPAGTCVVAVRYSPTDTTGVNGGISITDGTASATVAMSGTGLTVTTFSVSPGGPVSMGSKAIGYTSGATTFTVSVLNTATSDTGLITASLEGDNAADFAFVNNCLVSLVPGANCTMTVTFTPSAVGNRTATLAVKGAKGGNWPVVLTGVGLALVEVTPDPLPTAPATGLDFGTTPNGSLGDTLKYKVTVRGANAITATSTVASVALATGTPPDFVYVNSSNTPLTANPCNAATLGLTATTGVATGAAPTNWSISSGEWVCSFYVRFTPQTGRSATAKTATVTASATAGGTSSLTLTGIATGPLVFSNRTSTDILTLTLNNQGAAGVSQGPITVSLSNLEDFDVVSDTCTNTTLASAGSCTITLTFTPASVGAKTATITATANNPDPREDEVATAIVTGIAPPTFNVTISPNSDVNAPVDMGIVAQGNVGAWQNFTVSNPDGATKSGTLWYAVSGDYELYTLVTAGVTSYPAGYCGDNNTKQLDGGDECIIAVRLKPANTTAIGARAGTLTVKVGGSAGTPVLSTDGLGSVQLSGTAISQLTIAPAALDFGNVAENLPSFQETTITNIGLSAVTLSNIPTITTVPSIGNVSAAAASGGCIQGMSLAAGTSCVLKYQFQGTTAGTSIGYASDGTPTPLALSVTNGANVSAQVTVQGKVVLPANLARYGADDTNALNLGNVVVGSASGIVTLYFTNTGESDATGINASLTAGGPEFAIPAESDAVNPCNSLPANTLSAKGICSVRVQLTPTTAGAKTGTLSLVGTGVTGVTVALAGVGHGASTAGVYADLVSSPNTTFATFEATAVGATTNKVFFTLRNNTTGTLTFSNLTVTEFNETVPVSEFILAAESTGGGTACSTAVNGITASSTCQFSVRFTPDAYGTTDGRRYRWATINYSAAPIAGVIGPVLKPAKLQLSATSTDAVIVSGTTVNFGQVLEGANESFDFTVTNIGEAATAGAVTPTLNLNAGASYATLTHNCPAQLGAGATCTATVTVSSAADGLKNTTTLQAIGTGTESSAETFTLSAKIVRPALLSITPVTGTGTDFGAGTYIGNTDSGLITFTIRNGVSGNTSDNRQDSGALTVGLSNTSDFTIVTSSSTCYNATTGLYKVLGGAVATDLACTIDVQFNPRTIGARTATLAVTATPGSSLSANLTGLGLADLTISPAGTEAAPLALSGGSTGTFTITNNGPNATSALGTTVGGTNGSLFTITANNCVGNSIAAAGSCTVTLAFTGTSNATTAQTAMLTVTDGTAANTVTAYTKVGGP